MGDRTEARSARSDRPLTHAIGIALYALLALASTWPLAEHAVSRLPMGTEEARTVSMFNAWTIWWNADRLAHGGRRYWDAPIFYPARNAFAFSEPQPTTMVVAPIIWTTGSRVLAYNVYLWISLILNGWLTQILLRYLGLRMPIAIGAGAAMVLLPVVHWQIGVLQLVPLWGILWTWLAFAKIATPVVGPSSAKEVAWRGGELGLAFTVTFFTSVHHALFLAVLMVAAAWTLGHKLFHLRTLATLLVAVMLAALLSSPILVHLRKMSSENGFTRTREVVEQLSLQVRDYGTVYGNTCIPAQASDGTQTWQAFAGWLKLFWAMIGIYWGIFVDPRRAWTWFLLTVGLVAFALSLGTHLEVAGLQLWQLLIAYVPGFAQVRSAFRFVYFVQIAIVLAAAIGGDGVWGWASSYLQRAQARRMASGMLWPLCTALAVILLCAAAVVDPWPPRLRLGVVPDAARHRDWTDILRSSPQPGAVLCLPMAAGDHIRDFEITTEWMLLGSYHGRSLVNGYSGFFPAHYFQTREETRETKLSSTTLESLYNEGVRFVVVDRRRYRIDWQDGEQIGRLSVKHLQRSASGIDLYHLVSTLRIGKEAERERTRAEKQ